MSTTQAVIKAIQSIKHEIKPVLKFNLNAENVFAFDFSLNNSELHEIDLSDTMAFSDYIFCKMAEKGTPVALGRYNEERSIYARSELFESAEGPRTIHLGIDLWVQAGTAVYAPITGKVHSFKNNFRHGDYGPTIILQHEFNQVIFYTLYGHLTLDSIENMDEGHKIEAGQEIARIGNYPINGNWPPHLHFQIIIDMQGKKGDFWGVASAKDRNHLLELCPDPNIILNIRNLQRLMKT